jgi:hypothetical protein
MDGWIITMVLKELWDLYWMVLQGTNEVVHIRRDVTGRVTTYSVMWMATSTCCLGLMSSLHAKNPFSDLFCCVLFIAQTIESFGNSVSMFSLKESQLIAAFVLR